MRIEIHGHGIPLSDELRSYAQTRLWLAAQHHAARLAWISVLFSEACGEGESLRTTCKIAAGLRHGGTIDLRHTDANPFAAADLASARFEQALLRQMPETAPAASVEPAQWEVLT